MEHNLSILTIYNFPEETKVYVFKDVYIFSTSHIVELKHMLHKVIFSFCLGIPKH